MINNILSDYIKLKGGNYYNDIEKKSVWNEKKLIGGNRPRIMETYEIYQKVVLPFAKKKVDNKQWVIKIFEGKPDKDLIYMDDNFALVKDIRWSDGNVDELRVLAFFKDPKLLCIRELTSDHAPLLEEVKNKSLEIIKDTFGLDKNQLKFFFHYRPSIWQLHLHFININYLTYSSSIERAHSVESVIENLKLDSDYYKKVAISVYDELED